MVGTRGGRSFVPGYGPEYPRQPHHRSASCSSDYKEACNWDTFNAADDNPNVCWGGLVGGPGEADDFADVRQSYQRNEPAIDYNAGGWGGGMMWKCLGRSVPLGSGPACCVLHLSDHPQTIIHRP
jgi:hypothetical protein